MCIQLVQKKQDGHMATLGIIGFASLPPST